MLQQERGEGRPGLGMKMEMMLEAKHTMVGCADDQQE
jgi:hypothetical protein